MMISRILLLALGAALAFGAASAHAAETPDRELQMLGRCGIATSVYRSLLPPAKTPFEATVADKDLYARLQAVEPVLQARANAVAKNVGPEAAIAIQTELTGQYEMQMGKRGAPPLKSPREALDLYAPILEACIVRATLLSPAE